MGLPKIVTFQTKLLFYGRFGPLQIFLIFEVYRIDICARSQLALLVFD